MADRVAGGLFAKGNRVGVGRAPRRDGLALSRWFREALADPERRKKLLARIDRELQAANASHAAALAAQQAFMEEHQLASLTIRQSGLEQEKLRLAEQLQNQSVQKAMLDRQIAELNEQLGLVG